MSRSKDLAMQFNNFNKVSTSRPFILNTGGKVYSHSRVKKKIMHYNVFPFIRNFKHWIIHPLKKYERKGNYSIAICKIWSYY